jgi:hypothetical protein
VVIWTNVSIRVADRGTLPRPLPLSMCSPTLVLPRTTRHPAPVTTRTAFDMQESKKRPGTPEPVLKVDVPFEGAVRRLVQKPVPPEGVPDFRVRERTSPAKKRKSP